MTDEQIIKTLYHLSCAAKYKETVAMSRETAVGLYEYFNRRKAEIERLQKHIQEGVDLAKQIPEMLAMAQAEAIKDFAERLTHTLVINNEENTEFFDFSYTLETIDNLVKEMIGDQE